MFPSYACGAIEAVKASVVEFMAVDEAVIITASADDPTSSYCSRKRRTPERSTEWKSRGFDCCSRPTAATFSHRPSLLPLRLRSHRHPPPLLHLLPLPPLRCLSCGASGCCWRGLLGCCLKNF